MKINMLTSTRTIQNPNSGILLGLALLLLIALVTGSSTGVIRGGDEDDGSGIGGTGRMPTSSGGSGLGGTGLKPFIGLNTEHELEILIAPEQRESAVVNGLAASFETTSSVIADSIPTQAIVVANTQITRDSSAISISESIQHSIDTNALYFQRLQQQLYVSSSQASISESAAVADELDGAALSLAVSQDSELSEAEKGLESVTESLADTLIEPDQPLSWGAVASYLVANFDRDDIQFTERNDSETDEESTDRFVRPERLSRPELPPIQRVRPIQRIAILPPRVRPLQL